MLQTAGILIKKRQISFALRPIFHSPNEWQRMRARGGAAGKHNTEVEEHVFVANTDGCFGFLMA
jgi:hypothetical protein